MISQVTGRLATRDVERVEITTAGGVTYELSIPLGTFEALPPRGDPVTLFTHLVVRDDEWLLYGFGSAHERAVFRRLLAATGVGPALALGMLSRFNAERLVRAIREKDVDTLQSVPRVGRKKAQQLVLDLADKLDDLAGDGAPGVVPSAPGADHAVRALVSLGVAPADADKAVREAMADGGGSRDLASLIRDALGRTRK
ncbi:MAG TPA: Holliday junction branch migration protein RuvA [Gemmatimonadaceae bacterium]|nr:Holliday junction branch migration protein RuvA [Gemmatimonadaceae bacterium]